MKLSPAQREMLQSAVHGNGGCAENYPPAEKLVAMGLCTGQRSTFGSYRLIPTDAGRRALSDPEGKESGK